MLLGHFDNISTLACSRHTLAQLVYQTIDWSKQPSAIPHFISGHLFSSAYCLFLASVPLILYHCLLLSIALNISATSKIEKGPSARNTEILMPWCLLIHTVLSNGRESPECVARPNVSTSENLKCGTVRSESNVILI